jgi:hypothetical protein
MSNEDIKKEFAKTVFRSKVVAGIFFILLAPSIVMMFKDIPVIYGLDKQTWFNISVAGFVLYFAYFFLFWKCPSCGKFPGRGWFRKECNNCKAQLS